jgi:hypothetical protein
MARHRKKPKTVDALCKRCGQKAEHRYRNAAREILESACRPCKLEGSRAWRKENPIKAKMRTTWRNILERCLNPRHWKWRLYGGAHPPVLVSWRWQGIPEGFERFCADVGEPPSLKHTLDRKPGGTHNYEPGEVRWATVTEQNRNLSTNRLITFRGETHCLAEWAELLGIPDSTLQNRLDRNWPLEQAMNAVIPHNAEAPF